jgi:hypothetical protein
MIPAARRQGHHSTLLRKAYQEFREKGNVFLDEVCLEPGISASTCRRMEAVGRIPMAQKRHGVGGMTVRVVRSDEVARLKLGLHPRARPGNS